MLQLSVVMNGVTHGLGVILCVIGTMVLRNRVADASANTRIRYVKKGGRIIDHSEQYELTFLSLYKPLVVEHTLCRSWFSTSVPRYTILSLR